MLVFWNAVFKSWFSASGWGAIKELSFALFVGFAYYSIATWVNRKRIIKGELEAVSFIFIAPTILLGFAASILPVTVLIVLALGPFIGAYYFARWYAKRETMVESIVSRVAGDKR